MQPQAQAQQRTITVQAAGSSTTQPAVTATPPLQQQELATSSMPQVPMLLQRPLSATNPAYDLSVESSEAHAFTEQPQIAAGGSAVSVGQPVLPQSGLLELVSNPLYARSLDISRTTSTSPTRVDANAVAKQGEPAPESMLSEAPTGSAIVQVSDQPILAGSAEAPQSQASGSAVDLAEGLAAQQLVEQSAIAIEDTGTAVVPVDHTSQESELRDNPAVLQVSDQPIFTPGPASPPEAAPAETLPGAEAEMQTAVGTPPASVVAAPQQMSAQPLLASTTAMTVPAEHQARVAMLEQPTDSSMSTEVTDTGAAITVSNQPILGTTATEASPAVSAETVHVTSSQPVLRPVITQPHDSAAASSAMQQAPLPFPPVTSQEGLQLSQRPPQSLTQVSTESTPVMSSHPQLGPVLTQPSHPAATPMPTQQAPLSFPPEESHISQQPDQPVRQVSLEPTPVLSSQPLLGPELAHSQAPAPNVYQHVQAVQQQQQLTPHPQGMSHAESITSLQPVSISSTPTRQVSIESQGSVLRPPVPALPSVRRSTSDVRGSLQTQPSSVRRSVSILPATPESSAQAPPSTPLGPFPMPQLRRSVTSLPTSPVPHFPRTTNSSQVQPQQVVLHQAPLSMPPLAYLQHSSLGPLQEGIAAVPIAPPPQQQAHSRTLVQPASQPPATTVLPAAPMVLNSQAATPLVDPQKVHLTVTSSPQLYSEPSSSTVIVEQQAQPVLLQESRYVQLAAPQPEAAVVSQSSAVQMQGMTPSSPTVGQQAEFEPQPTQVLEASPPLQHNPPVFMRSFDAGAPQHALPRPAHSPQIMRTNTWSPHPNILQPAVPGQAGPTPDVQGPLSMGFQQSWNNPVPALPEAQTAPPVSPPGVQRDYIHSRAYPTVVSAPPSSPPRQAYAYGQTSVVSVPPSTPPLQAYAYGQSLPVQQANFAYGGSMPMTSGAAGYAAANSRAYPIAMSVPMASGSREAYSAVAPTSMAMYEQPGPLSGGLAQHMGPPSRQPPRQQLSMSSRSVPASLVPGTVIQPMQGPVVVGEQSAAVTTEPMLTHSQGFSIQPLSQAQGAMQGTRGFNPAVMQTGSPSQQQQQQQQQQQPEASRQGGGGIAKRILQDFGRSSRSSFNAGASVNTSFQSDRSLQQVTTEGARH